MFHSFCLSLSCCCLRGWSISCLPHCCVDVQSSPHIPFLSLSLVSVALRGLCKVTNFTMSLRWASSASWPEQVYLLLFGNMSVASHRWGRGELKILSPTSRVPGSAWSRKQGSDRIAHRRKPLLWSRHKHNLCFGLSGIPTSTSQGIIHFKQMH